MKYKELIDALCDQYQKVLGENFVGIYVHGSIAFDCFTWDKSDIDFIAVVEEPLSQTTKLDLLDTLESFREAAPKKGFEMSVVLKKYCQNFVYPTPYELHFSLDWLDRYLADPVSICGDGFKTDADLAAHFTVINHVGIAWRGEAIKEVFGAVPTEDYLDSIRLDVQNAKEDVLKNPVYVILNLCRVYAYARDGLVLSKAQGGEWGLRQLPGRYRGLIANMLNHYTLSTPIAREDDSLESDFCMYMLEKIFGEAD